MCSMTFGKKYGVCRDKAALLVAMLREAGLQAYPVLISVGTKRDPEVPDPVFQPRHRRRGNCNRASTC